MADDKTYTEVEHVAIMAETVKRETAEVTTAKNAAETKVTELTSKVDVLEAEKASAEKERDEAKQALVKRDEDDTRKAQVETAKTERVTQVKAKNDQLPDTYFTDERVQHWAEMTEEAFTVLLDAIPASVAGSGEKETAAFKGGAQVKAPEAKTATTGSLFAALRGVKN